VHAVEILVAQVERGAECGVVVAVGGDGVPQQVVGHGVERLDEGGVLQFVAGAHFLGALGDAGGVVGDALKVHRDFHRGNDEPQIRRHGVVFHQDVHAELVDDALRLIDLVVVGDHRVGEFGVALHEGADGALEVEAGAGGHGEHFAFQRGDGLVEVPEDVGRAIHFFRFKTSRHKTSRHKTGGREKRGSR
jgi:hypothetical protein